MSVRRVPNGAKHRVQGLEHRSGFRATADLEPRAAPADVALTEVDIGRRHEIVAAPHVCAGSGDQARLVTVDLDLFDAIALFGAEAAQPVRVHAVVEHDVELRIVETGDIRVDAVHL